MSDITTPRLALTAQSTCSSTTSHLSGVMLKRSPGTTASDRNSPLGMEDAVEGGASPVLARQREHSSEVVEGDMALWEGALQPGFLEGGPLLLQGPGATQVPLRQTR